VISTRLDATRNRTIYTHVNGPLARYLDVMDASDIDSRFVPEPSPRTRNPLLRALRFAWTLPTNVVGHLAGVLASGSSGRLVRSDLAVGRVYVIRAPFVRSVGGVTLGHAILLSPTYAEGQLGRLVLAHELAHTRQHDVLGPFYLPAHAVAQLVSALRWVVMPVPGSDPVHAHNRLEQRWLFLGHAWVRRLQRGEGDAEVTERLLQRLGC